ncbi:PA14 domain-containing protein [Microseira sp. BLCC-F43]|jgi:hypothetical protein|uniref:PA14 domain-containing protein n=1 Tax=Microseira sp. BLCC-F43 TaxID=3153602 RepID=UPI0035BB88AA
MLETFGSDPNYSLNPFVNPSQTGILGNVETTAGMISPAAFKNLATGGTSHELTNAALAVPKIEDSLMVGKNSFGAQIKDTNKNVDKSVDSLTGIVLSQGTDSSEVTPILQQALQSARDSLTGLATDPNYNSKMNLAFGENFDPKVANDLVQKLAKGDFTELPAIKILPSAAINGANGAFAKATNTIYLSSEFVSKNAVNPQTIASVILEETGHYIDSQINTKDAAGDEGDIFARVVQGKTISAGELLELKAEDDTALISLDGQAFWIEQASSIPVTFKTFEKSKYVVAEGGGGSVVNANRDVASFWETFTLIDLNGGSLNSGDVINIVAQNRQYMVAEGGGGGVVNANRIDPGPWEEFKIIKVNGGGRIGSGDSVALRAKNGQYVVAEGGGGGSVNANRNTIGSWEKFIINFSAAQPQIPANRWKAEYFNNINLTGNPTFVEDLGDGKQAFSRNWGNSSPTNTPSDNFSARMTTQRYLAPGLYKITTQADDGIKVRIGNQTVVDKWVDQPFVTNSGYFYSNGGNFPIAVEYYERGGSAAINFNLQQASKFQDSVNEYQQWKATVFNWNGSQGNQPPINFWNGEMNNPNAIGVINLGSNTRSDGKKGINVDWGDGAPNGDGNRLPHNNFAIGAYTWADFDGSAYKFRVRGDDGFQIRAKNHSTGEWFDITAPNQWTQAYGFTEITKTLPAGRYDLAFNYYEHGVAANFDLSWEKAGNPDIDIQLFYPNGGFTDTQKAIFEQAATNWESIITRDKVSSGILKIAITQGSKGILGSNWMSGIAAESWMDNSQNYRQDNTTNSFSGNNFDGDGRTHFNSAFINSLSRNNLLRLTMHEIGHTLGLDEAQFDSSLYDTAGDSLMDYRTPDQGGQDMKITEGMYKKLEWLGYGVNRNQNINCS